MLDRTLDPNPAGLVADARRRRASGYLFLVMASVGWGLNWPVMKYLLTELPPLTARGFSGIVGAALIAGYALARRQSLHVPRTQWFRLGLSALLNVTSWMTLMGLALLWLPASEAAVIAYTMPVWASVLAWPILGERLTWLRVVSLLMACGGLVALMGGNGISASLEKAPGIVMALVGALGFALGTIVAKKWPVALPPATSAAWQIGIGCLPVALAGLAFEKADWLALSSWGWVLAAYMTLIQFCVSYVSWFAALERLPASVAAIGTLLVPLIGVVVSAITLGEPLGPGQIAALILTLAGVILATRS